MLAHPLDEERVVDRSLENQERDEPEEAVDDRGAAAEQQALTDHHRYNRARLTALI
jgi:hypothetical protein